MRTIWVKARPHLLSWHMLPCLAMLVGAIGIAIATGRPTAVLGALACMVMMVVMMSGMHGHGQGHGGHSDHNDTN